LGSSRKFSRNGKEILYDEPNNAWWRYCCCGAYLLFLLLHIFFVGLFVSSFDFIFASFLDFFFDAVLVFAEQNGLEQN